MVLKDPDEICKLSKGLKYQHELEFLITNDKRNNFLIRKPLIFLLHQIQNND